MGCGNAEDVQLLLKAGADPNTADKKGCTSLYHAADRGNAEAIPLLLKAGADPNIASAPLFRAYDKEPVQYTALMVFRDGVFRWGYDDDVLALLEAAGAATLVAISPADRTAALVAKQFNSNDPDDKNIMSPKRRAAALAAALAAMSPADTAATLATMSPADRTAALAAMSPEDRAATLAAMSPEDRAAMSSAAAAA